MAQIKTPCNIKLQSFLVKVFFASTIGKKSFLISILLHKKVWGENIAIQTILKSKSQY